MNCNYPAIITFEDNVYYVAVPDMYDGEINYYETYADTLEKATEYAKEVFVLYLKSYKDENKDFPKPSSFEKLQKGLNDNQFIINVEFDYNYEAKFIKSNIEFLF